MKIFNKIFILLCLVSSLIAGKLNTYVKDLKPSKTLVKLSQTTLINLQNQKKISLHVNENLILNFDKTRSKVNNNGSVVWSGKDIQNNATALLSYFNNALIGSINIGKNEYELYLKNNHYIISKKDKNKYFKPKKHISPTLPQSNKMLSNSLQTRALKIRDVAKDYEIKNGKLQLNLLAFYAPSFNNNNQEKGGAIAVIQHLINVANETFENSKLGIELNLIHSQTLNVPGDDIEKTYANFKKNKQVIALKRKHKAHFASLFQNFRSYACGIANATNDMKLFKLTTFSVMEYDSTYCSDTALVHELGHNFGCDHDESTRIYQGYSNVSGMYPYSQGYDSPDLTYGTIMSYNASEIVKHFSEPVTWHGKLLGTHQTNNVKTINQTKFTLANQFNEKLENTDIANTYLLKGTLQGEDDADGFKMGLNETISFSGSTGQYITVYDDNGNMITSNYENFTHTFSKGVYQIVINAYGDDIYNNTRFALNYPNDYNIQISGNTFLPSNPQQLFEQTIHLQRGWNLAALQKPMNINLSNLNNPNIQSIKTYENGSWKIWNKNSSSLQTIKFGTAYWIKASKNTNLIVKSKLTNDTSKNPTAGNWKMLGGIKIDNLQEYFNQNPNIKIVWKYENGKFKAFSTDRKIKQDLQKANIEQITHILPNQGFFVK